MGQHMDHFCGAKPTAPMCQHADHTQERIQHLQDNVYPCLLIKLNNASNCAYLQALPDAQKSPLLEAIAALRQEFQSLITYEAKLVFPAVMKVFEAKKGEKGLPNLADLIQLTRSKEQKMKAHLQRIEGLLQSQIWANGGYKQKALVETFQHEFSTEKTLWNSMVEDRLTNCRCFRKEFYFDDKPMTIQPYFQPDPNQPA